MLFVNDTNNINAWLQILFIIQNMFGVYYWNTVIKKDVTKLKDKTLLSIFISQTIITSFFLYIIDTMMGSSFPKFDSITASISLWATILLILKKIENWYFWAVANIIYIWFFIESGHYLSSGLYTILLILNYYGYKEWKRNIKVVS